MNQAYKSTPIILATILLLSCTTMDIKSAAPISVPDILSTQDIKIAILNSVNPIHKEIKLKPFEKMTDNALKAFFGWSYQKIGRRKRWFVESVQPKSIFVGFDDGRHYFRVE